jgi:hypothetical protein
MEHNAAMLAAKRLANISREVRWSIFYSAFVRAHLYSPEFFFE